MLGRRSDARPVLHGALCPGHSRARVAVRVSFALPSTVGIVVATPPAKDADIGRDSQACSATDSRREDRTMNKTRRTIGLSALVILVVLGTGWALEKAASSHA